MRVSAAIVVTVLVLAAAMGTATRAFAAPKEEEVARARVLDQQGVRAYKDGRYNDAIRFFTEALKLGGPASELWNIAKCHIRLDEPEQASDAYDRYLTQPGLTPQDKADAREELEELRRRRSIVTVASTPSRGIVYLDGKRAEAAGTTPFSVQLSAGTHKIEIALHGYVPFSQDVEAKYGRAIIVDAQLERDPNQPLTPPTTDDKTPKMAPPPEAPKSDFRPKHFTAKAEMGVVFSKLGTVSESGRFGLAVSAAYWLLDAPKWSLGVGFMVTATNDTWGNSIHAPNTGPGCTLAISADEDATEVAGYGIGAVGYRVTPRFRIGADAGLGASGYGAGALGGDVFYPTCQPSPGAQIAARFGVEASYAFFPFLRGVVSPLGVQVHPPYSGARATPIDASGAWVRLSLGLGVAVDL